MGVSLAFLTHLPASCVAPPRPLAVETFSEVSYARPTAVQPIVILREVDADFVSACGYLESRHGTRLQSKQF